MIKPPIELRNGYKDKAHLCKVAMMKCFACRIEKPKWPNIPGRLEIHHKTGCGLGKKASDLLTIPLCNYHHQKGQRGFAIHRGVFVWEEKFGRQEDLILEIHEKLGITIYKDYLDKNKLLQVN